VSPGHGIDVRFTTGGLPGGLERLVAAPPPPLED